MKTQTHLDLFKKFCKENGIAPILKKGSTTIYILPPETVKIEFFGLDIDPPEITVYFTEEGKWIGGTNWLWDKRLPWVKARLQDRKKAVANHIK